MLKLLQWCISSPPRWDPHPSPCPPPWPANPRSWRAPARLAGAPRAGRRPDLSASSRLLTGLNAGLWQELSDLLLSGNVTTSHQTPLTLHLTYLAFSGSPSGTAPPAWHLRHLRDIPPRTSVDNIQSFYSHFTKWLSFKILGFVWIIILISDGITN